jgi:transketolase
LTHFPTVAPMDEAAIDALIDRYDVLVTVEEHLPTGGLGTAVAEIVAGSSQQVVFSRMSLPGHYATKYGSQSDHWHSAGLDAAGIASRVRSLVPGSVDAAITGVE